MIDKTIGCAPAHPTRTRSAFFNSKILLSGLAGLAIALFSASPSQAYYYELCIGIPDVSEAGTDDEGVTVQFIGAFGRSQWLTVSKPGNDMNRGTTSCYDFDSAQTDIGDIGYINRVRLSFSGGDDFCINKITVGTKDKKSNTQTATNAEGYNRETEKKCLGNESYSTDHLDFVSRNPFTTPTFDGGSWKTICTGRCGLSEIQTEINETETSSKLTNRELEEVSKSLKVNYDAGGSYKAEGTIAKRSETEMINETASRILNKTSYTISRDMTLTPEQMKEFNISAMHIWQMKADMGRENLTILSNRIICTTTINPPPFGPFDERGQGSCSGGLIGK